MISKKYIQNNLFLIFLVNIKVNYIYKKESKIKNLQTNDYMILGKKAIVIYNILICRVIKTQLRKIFIKTFDLLYTL